MIDKVSARLPSGDSVPDVSGKLENLQHHTSKNGRWVSGFVAGIRVTQSENMVSISGSLPRFLSGSNARHVTRQSTQKAVEGLSAALGISQLGEAIVSRFEIAVNIVIRHPVSAYLPLLQHVPRHKRMAVDGESVTFLGTCTTLKLYDKPREQEDTGIPLSESYKAAQHVLRIELTLARGLHRYFHAPVVRLSDLYEPRFYAQCGHLLMQHYRKIRKSPSTTGTMPIENPKDLERFLAVAGLNHLGESRIHAQIEKHGSRVMKSRIRERLQEIRAAAGEHGHNDLSKELETSLMQALAYFR